MMTHIYNDPYKTEYSIKISVIIPMFNAQKYIAGCLDFLLKQKMRDIEIICVDDGSEDSTVDIVNSYLEKNESIILSRQDHRSAGAARNVGIDMARGDYLAIFDVDDIYHDDMLEKMYGEALRTSADIVVCQSGEIDEDTGLKREIAADHLLVSHLPTNGVFNRAKRDREISFFSVFVGWTWDKLFKADFIRKNRIRFQDQRSNNDLLFVYSSLVKADSIAVVREPLVDKRVRKHGSISSDMVQNKSWQDSFLALYSLKNKLDEWGVLDDFWKDYINYVLSFTIYNMERFLLSDSFKDMVESFRDEWGRKLGVIDCDEGDFYEKDDYKLLSLMKMLSVDEFNMILSTKISDEHFLFPFELVEKGSDIALYSAGNVGRAFFNQIRHSDYCNLVAWFDKKANNKKCAMLKAPHSISEYRFDTVVIAVADSKVAEEIINELIMLGVEREKIVWAKPRYI